MTSHDVATKIKSAIRLSDYAKRFIEIKKKGHNRYVALCPFHREKTPSFTIRDEHNTFHCFGCNASGDVISFAMKVQNMTYLQAIKSLAGELGIKIPSKRVSTASQKSYEIHKIVADWYHKVLISLHEGKYALAYLLDRGITRDVIERYKIGYAPDNIESLQLLLTKFTAEDLEYSKIFYVKDKSLVNPFYKRVIFPIFDVNDNIVGFGGRIITSSANQAKYINSTESPVFKKKELFYGLNVVCGDPQKEPQSPLEKGAAGTDAKAHNFVVVVEGYLDVLGLASQSFNKAVAPLGTGINVAQIAVLWKKFDEVIVCFDNDKAGMDGMLRIAKNLLEYINVSKKISFLLLPNDVKDPDECIRKYGLEGWNNVLSNNKVSLGKLLFYSVCNSAALAKNASIEEKASVRERLFKLANEIKDKNLKFEYGSYFHKLYLDFVKTGRKKKNPYNISHPADEEGKVDLNVYFSNYYVSVKPSEGILKAIDEKAFIYLLFGAIMKNPIIRKNDDIIAWFWDIEIEDNYLAILRNVIIYNQHESNITSCDDWIKAARDLCRGQGDYGVKLHDSPEVVSDLYEIGAISVERSDLECTVNAIMNYEDKMYQTLIPQRKQVLDLQKIFIYLKILFEEHKRVLLQNKMGSLPKVPFKSKLARESNDAELAKLKEMHLELLGKIDKMRRLL